MLYHVAVRLIREGENLEIQDVRSLRKEIKLKLAIQAIRMFE